MKCKWCGAKHQHDNFDECVREFKEGIQTLVEQHTASIVRSAVMKVLSK